MKLFDIVDTFISGDWGSESKTDETTVQVHCLRSADIVPIYQFDFDNIPYRYVSQRSFDTRELKEGDIVIEKSGGTDNCSTGRPIYVSKNLLEKNTPLMCSNFCGAFRVKQGWSPLYIYYYLRLIHKSNIFFNFEGKTSGIHNLDIDSAFKAIDIPEISYNDQLKIAKAIANLDRKISLNRQMNATLEKIAKQLYDYWFVQFDFPDEEGKPYKSSGGKMVYNETLKREIPVGWEVGNILKVSSLITGGTPSKSVSEYWDNGVIPFFGPTDCNGSMYQIKTEYKITDEGVKHSAAKLMKEGTVIITARGSIGKYVIVGKPMAMNQSCFAFYSTEKCNEYLYFLTQQLIQHLIIKGSGSTFKSIVGVDIENSIMCLGVENLRKDFSERMQPILQKIKTNTLASLRLESLRDYLLPLLMNGQVKLL